MASEFEVATLVEAERGRWWVYLVITNSEGVERRRLQDYPTEAKARLAADIVARTAAR